MADAFHIGSPDPTTRPVNLGPDYPTEIEVRVGNEIKKFPVAYFEKVVLKTGQYTHPRTGVAFTITLSRLAEFEDKANRMIAENMEIPTPVDHKEDQVAKKKNPYFVSSKDNMGFVVKATREGERLKFIQAAIGEDAALTAIRNRSSVWIKPFVDEKGRDWGTCIVHSAYTPIPVMSGLGPHVPLSRESDDVVLELARDQENIMKLSEAQRKRLIAISIILGTKKEDAEKLDDAALQDKGVEYLEKLPDGDPVAWKRELDQTTKDLEKKTEELTQSASRETELKQQLSKEENAPTGREIKNARTSACERVDAAVLSKKFSPPTGEFIKERINTEPISLTLSREDDDDKPELFEDLMKVAELAAKTPNPGTSAKKGDKDTKLSREQSAADDDSQEDKPKTEAEKGIDLANKAAEKFRKTRQAPVLSGQTSKAGDDD